MLIACLGLCVLKDLVLVWAPEKNPRIWNLEEDPEEMRESQYYQQRSEVPKEKPST